MILAAVLASLVLLWLLTPARPAGSLAGTLAAATLAAVALSAGAAWLVVRSAAARQQAIEREITQRAAAKVAAAEAETEQLMAVMGGMSEGVLVTDAEGRVSFANPQWRLLFGLTGDVEGASVLEMSRQTALDQMLGKTLASGESQQIELELSDSPSGARSTLILTSASLSDGEGAVVVAQDVTAVLRLTEIRRDFVANVSHELKTPLSAIRGFAETLADGLVEDPEASKEYLDRILKQCRRLEALLSDLLTLSRLEHAADERRQAPIDLGRILQEAIEVVNEGVSGKKLDLAVTAQPIPRIEGDATALERMCVNLLDNAVKYNREGGKIQVRLFESGRRVVLEVEDTGIGIPEGSVERLFERFYRVDKGRSRQEGGTGLGLAIVKHAAHLHGGTVEVDSELGRGSLFRVLLPVD